MVIEFHTTEMIQIQFSEVSLCSFSFYLVNKRVFLLVEWYRGYLVDNSNVKVGLRLVTR